MPSDSVTVRRAKAAWLLDDGFGRVVALPSFAKFRDIEMASLTLMAIPPHCDGCRGTPTSGHEPECKYWTRLMEAYNA